MRRGVKSRSLIWALGLAAGLSQPAIAHAQAKRDPPFLLGPVDDRKAPVARDPWLPTGSPVVAGPERPASVEPAGCSPRAPVCVHRGPGVAPAVAARALAELERAYVRLVRVLGLPAPASDGAEGGSSALDLYLREGGGPDVLVGGVPRLTGPFDQAAGFCVLGGAQRALLAREATLCVAESIALGLDPAETPHLRRAYASHLWLATGEPTSVDVERFDYLQASPELALGRREARPMSDAAALLFEYLDEKRGYRTSGHYATSILSAGVRKTAPGAWLWENDVDVFEVLRRNLGEPREVGKLFLDLAVTRAFLGDCEDGTHLPALEWLGAFGRPRFEWSIPFSTLPRRVAPRRPIEPTGSIYVWLELDQVPKEAELGFQAEWEPPVTFHWSLVRVAEDGQELGRLDAPFVERGTVVEQTLVDLQGARGILIVGTNLGGTDLAHPFDPDSEPFEPHGCTVYLAKL